MPGAFVLVDTSEVRHLIGGNKLDAWGPIFLLLRSLPLEKTYWYPIKTAGEDDWGQIPLARTDALLAYN